MSIFILHAPIRSGKTTALYDRICKMNSVGGILAIDGEGGLRYLYTISDRSKHRFQITQEIGYSISIGRFHFLKSTFITACKECVDSYYHLQNRFTIIDEFGPLEMNGEGLMPTIGSLIVDAYSSRDKLVVIVMRNKIVGDFMTKFNFNKEKVKLIDFVAQPDFSLDENQ
ncbi:MAG TPA: hypothetical protein PK006_11815 [Saprospiraceae bacterium]|nr:hypothetical protein [Saprospiraceae bacterium]